MSFPLPFVKSASSIKLDNPAAHAIPLDAQNLLWLSDHTPQWVMELWPRDTALVDEMALRNPIRMVWAIARNAKNLPPDVEESTDEKSFVQWLTHDAGFDIKEFSRLGLLVIDAFEPFADFASTCKALLEDLNARSTPCIVAWRGNAYMGNVVAIEVAPPTQLYQMHDSTVVFTVVGKNIDDSLQSLINRATAFPQ